MAIALAAALAAVSLQGQAAGQGQSAGPQTSCSHFDAPWGSASYELFMVLFDHDSSRITAERQNLRAEVLIAPPDRR